MTKKTQHPIYLGVNLSVSGRPGTTWKDALRYRGIDPEQYRCVTWHAKRPLPEDVIATFRVSPHDPKNYVVAKVTAADALTAAFERLEINTSDLERTEYEYYADETDETYRVTRDELIDLGRALADDPENIAYSLWCASGAGELVEVAS